MNIFSTDFNLPAENKLLYIMYLRNLQYYQSSQTCSSVDQDEMITFPLKSNKQ